MSRPALRQARGCWQWPPLPPTASHWIPTLQARSQAPGGWPALAHGAWGLGGRQRGPHNREGGPRSGGRHQGLGPHLTHSFHLEPELGVDPGWRSCRTGRAGAVEGGREGIPSPRRGSASSEPRSRNQQGQGVGEGPARGVGMVERRGRRARQASRPGGVLPVILNISGSCEALEYAGRTFGPVLCICRRLWENQKCLLYQVQGRVQGNNTTSKPRSNMHTSLDSYKPAGYPFPTFIFLP